MIAKDSLVLYKTRPARVGRVADKLEVELEGGRTQRVRFKDVELLHPGPLGSLADLVPQPGEVRTAWELLAGGQTTLPELAELVYGAYTPATAWATWELVADGLYFRGTPQEVLARTAEEVAQEQATRQAKAAERQAWEAFLERARAGRVAPEDESYLQEVGDLALKRADSSRVMRELGWGESPENAHALLLELGYWDETVNPYPQRLNLVTTPCELEPPPLPDEPRTDLTHLLALAIDDAGTQTPDDALSLEGERLWVHVADPAALIPPDSPIDLEARARGASIHLPERLVQMLPGAVTEPLGLGLTETSPALSFGLNLDAKGQIAGMEIVPSWVRVTRLTYEEAEARLDEQPLAELYRLSQLYRARRRANGGVFIDFPEVRVQVDGGEVSLRLLPALKSREVVQEAMIMAGEAVAHWALERNIPLPFTTQEPPESHEPPQTLSEMFALRRTLKPSQYSSLPAPHAGVGLDFYVQATSPLRRYLDLVVHQQLRAHLGGGTLLDAQQVMERIGATEAVSGSVRQAERLSDRHWILVYLLRHPEWTGEGVVLDKRERRARLLIPELGLELTVHLPADVALDSSVSLILNDVDLPQLEVFFRSGR